MNRSLPLIILSGACVLLIAAAPSSQQQQDKPVVPKEKIVLFNGKDFTGWTFFLADANTDPNNTWSIKDGVIRCEGKPGGYMHTELAYADYIFHLEYRWPAQPGNSGVFAHAGSVNKLWPRCLECQLKSGEAGDFLSMNGVDFKEHISRGKRTPTEPSWKSALVIKLNESSENPPGQWNTYQIVAKDDWLMLIVNGVVQNIATKLNTTSGRLCLQSEGTPIEFRNIYLTPTDIQ